MPFRCRALIVQLVIDEVDADGNVCRESRGEPTMIFPKFWPDIPRLVQTAIDAENAKLPASTPAPPTPEPEPVVEAAPAPADVEVG